MGKPHSLYLQWNKTGSPQTIEGLAVWTGCLEWLPPLLEELWLAGPPGATPQAGMGFASRKCSEWLLK